MARIIKTDGTEIFIEPNNGTDFSLKELQDIVGGYIEIVRLPNFLVVANEEGLLLELEPNTIASLMAGTMIVGDVLICKHNEVL